MEEEKRGGSFSHRVAHGRLQGGILLGLAADVIEGEEQVVVVGEVGGNLHLYLLVELWGPAEIKRGNCSSSVKGLSKLQNSNLKLFKIIRY